MAIELELAGRESGHGLASVGEVGLEEILDTLIGRAEGASVVHEQVLLLLIGLKDGVDQAEEVLVLALG